MCLLPNTGIINLLRFLDVEARKTKGAVYMLNGNHESLNVCGDFRWVGASCRQLRTSLAHKNVISDLQ